MSLTDVYAALAYYHDHRVVIDSQMAEGEKLVEEMRGHYPSKIDATLRPHG